MTTLTFPLPSADTAIILNGTRDLALSRRLTAYSQWIITDGAWQDSRALYDNLSTQPKLTVLGDGDSIRQAPPHFIHTPDPNYTDFEKALHYAVNHTVQSADVFWANGDEADHFLGSLSVAAKYADVIQLRFISAKQCYLLLTEAHNPISLVGVRGCTISLYPFPTARISASGLRYPLNDLTLTQHQQQSLRNHADSDTVTLNIQGYVWVFISVMPL